MDMPTFQHSHPFDPTYGYTFDQLLQLQPPPAPEGFDEFWQATYAEAMTIAPEPTLEPRPSPNPDYRVTVVRFNSLGGRRIGGWLIEPLKTQPTRFVVRGHGYGNPDDGWMGFDPTAIALHVHKRGFGLSRFADIPDAGAWHVLHGIGSKETYVHRGCVVDLWLGASAMLELFPQAAGRLEYSGGSFGGGTGAMAIAWDKRIVLAHLGVPSFGNHPLRVTLQMTGSGASVRAKYEKHPEIMQVLKFYDSATHATRITIPTHVDCALFDPGVPPPGQFTVYNAIRSPKKLFVRQAAHFEYDAKEDDAKCAASFKAFWDEYFPRAKQA